MLKLSQAKVIFIYHSNYLVLERSRSTFEFGNILSNKLEMLNQKIEKKQQIQKKESNKLESYFVDQDDSGSNDSFEDAKQPTGSIMDNNISDLSNLVDIELIKLLKYCGELKKFQSNDDYQEEVMMKSFELGKLTQPKLLIFDMDETLVAAKFAGHIPSNFQPTFTYPLQG